MSVMCSCAIVFALQLHAQSVGPAHGPAHGALVISGGAETTTEIYKRFIELAGGPDSLILVVPTSGGADKYDDTCDCLRWLKLAGATNLKLLHTTERAVANSDAFVEPIRKARGIWFAEGNSWRYQDAYLDTKVQSEVMALLARGGVVGGGSAGARIQSDYLPYRSPEPSTRAIPKSRWRSGFALVRNVIIDPHVLARNRQFDLIGMVKAHPNMLGIGIDEDAAIVVRGDRFEVIGNSYAIIYDNQRQIAPESGETLRTTGGLFYMLRPGDSYDMQSRRASRPPSGEAPTNRLIERAWQAP
jgi:cyanophycinase